MVTLCSWRQILEIIDKWNQKYAISILDCVSVPPGGIPSQRQKLLIPHPICFLCQMLLSGRQRHIRCLELTVTLPPGVRNRCKFLIPSIYPFFIPSPLSIISPWLIPVPYYSDLHTMVNIGINFRGGNQLKGRLATIPPPIGWQCSTRMTVLEPPPPPLPSCILSPSLMWCLPEAYFHTNYLSILDLDFRFNINYSPSL